MAAAAIALAAVQPVIAKPKRGKAASPVQVQMGKHMRGVQRVGLTACNVVFAEQASATSSTHAGLFNTDQRAESSATMVYTLVGLEETDMQAMADGLCALAEQKLAAAGYEVVPFAQLREHERFQRLQEVGKASPYKFSRNPSKYMVFSRSGAGVFSPQYLGTGANLSQAFKAASEGSAEGHQGVVMHDLGFTAINLDLVLGFADLSTDERKGMRGRLAKLGNKDGARIEGSARLTASGQLELRPLPNLKCWELRGRSECMTKWTPRFTSKQPVSVEDRFYSSVTDVTTTGDKIGSAFTMATAALGGSSSRSLKRMQVDTDAESYRPVAEHAVAQLLDQLIDSTVALR